MLLVRRIHTVEAGRDGRRTGDAHVHLGRACSPHHAHDLARRCTANDGVVDQNDALALKQGARRVELHTHAEVAHTLGGLDEGAADVVVADEPEVISKEQKSNLS